LIREILLIEREKTDLAVFLVVFLPFAAGKAFLAIWEVCVFAGTDAEDQFFRGAEYEVFGVDASSEKDFLG